MGKKKAESMQFWTKEEFDTFVKAVSDKPLSKTAFYLFFYSGMREGELLALTLNDFDFDNNTVSITKNYARLGTEDIIQTPKTPKSRRTITLPAEIMKMVREYTQCFMITSLQTGSLQLQSHILHTKCREGASCQGLKRYAYTI